MPRSSDSIGSGNGEWATVSGEETEDEDQVDRLFGSYLEQLRMIDNFPNQSEENREACREEAEADLLRSIGQLDNVEKALAKVVYLLGKPLPTKTTVVTQQQEGSSVELIEDENQKDEPERKVEENAENIKPKEEVNLVQLFDINEDGETLFDRSVLESLCDQIGNRPVAVISTAGKFRQGKTFLNNILLKGLQDGVASFKPDDYIGGHGGIRFQSGYERHTKGIMVWPEVFIRKDKNDREVAVILMDTQGTFDTETHISDSAVIFSISLLMSSIQIFNVRSQLDAQDLDSLNLFLAFSQRTDQMAGQHFLIMIRDALESGLRPDYIEGLKQQTRKAPELGKLLTGIFDAFEKVDCFMAEPPSIHVRKASGEIRAGDCGDTFLNDLCDCINYLLKNLVPKKVLGTYLTGNTLKQYVENLVDNIRDNNHRAIGSAFQATSELFFEKARTLALECFTKLHEQLIREHGHRPIDPKAYKENLDKFLEQSLALYNAQPLFGSPEAKNKVFESFKQSLEDKCTERQMSNDCRFRDVLMADATQGSLDLYEKMMKPDFESLIETKSVEQLKERHEKAYTEAINHFENAVQPFNDQVELVNYKRKLLIDSITIRFEDMQKDNMIVQINASMRKMIDELGEFYSKHFKEQVIKVKKLTDIEDFNEHARKILNANYELKKSQFVISTIAQMPSLGENLLRRMIDNYKNTQDPMFKKCEDNFESDVRVHFEMEKLRLKLQEIRSKQQQGQKKTLEEQRKTQEKLDGLQNELEEERRKREQAERSGSSIEMNPMFLLLKQMNDQTQRQLQRELDEREEARQQKLYEQQMREQEMQNEREMRRMEIEAKERKEARVRQEEKEEREEKRLRDEVAQKLRASEEKKKEAERKAQEEEDKKNRGFLRKAGGWLW